MSQIDTTLDEICNAQYVSLETFRKNGQGVKTPIWQACEKGKLYMWTDAKSWKIKRLRNNSRVNVCKSDSQGKPLGDWVEAQAIVLDDPELAKRYRQLVGTKYRPWFWIFAFVAFIRRADYAIIEVDLSNAQHIES
ncbi:MAG: PPOX class F420-dependent oxidoreductase [Chloroflexota bacterium]